MLLHQRFGLPAMQAVRLEDGCQIEDDSFAVWIINQSLVKNEISLYCENAIYPACKIG